MLASLEEHRSLWPDFLSKGGVLVELTEPLAPLQELKIVLRGGALAHPVPLTAQVAFLNGNRAMLQFQDVGPEVLASLNPENAPATVAPVAPIPLVVTAALPEAPPPPPTLEAGDRLVFRDAAAFVATRRDLLTAGTVTALATASEGRAEVWLGLQIGTYTHPVLLAARASPRANGTVLLQFVKGSQFAREFERLDAAVGLRPRRPRSGLIRSALDDLRSSPSRPSTSYPGSGSTPPVWEPVEAVPVSFVPRPPEPTYVPPPPVPLPVWRDEPEASTPEDLPVAESKSPSEAPAPRVSATVLTAAQQLAQIRRSGDFSNPRRASDFLSLPAVRPPTDAELVRPSALLLFRWLAGLSTSQVGEFQTGGKTISITIQGKDQLRSDTPIPLMGKLLSGPMGTYKVLEKPQTPILPHPARTRTVMIEILRYGIRGFEDVELHAAFAARKAKIPKLKPTGEKVIEMMDFAAPLERTASRMLAGQHTVDEILMSGIGAKAGWEVLVLLDLFGALTWTP